MITEAQKAEMIRQWGQETSCRIQEDVRVYAEKWSLTDLSLVEHYSMNAIFTGYSRQYGPCILKIGGGISDSGFLAEYRVLREYSGGRYVSLLESDVENGKNAMLLQRIQPGTVLKEEANPKRRLEVFVALYDNLHVQPADPTQFPRYAAALEEHIASLTRRGGREDLLAHVLKARDAFASASKQYHREMLLHGDLHSGNILLGQDGQYVIIDPQGLVGDPVFDLSRFILIEHYNSMDMPAKEHRAFMDCMFQTLAQRLDIPEKIIRQCFYVETVLFESWWASVGDYNIANPNFAENIMRNFV